MTTLKDKFCVCSMAASAISCTFDFLNELPAITFYPFFVWDDASCQNQNG